MRITVLLTAKPRDGQGLKAFRLGTGADHDHLHRIEQQALEREAVAAGVKAEVLHNAGERCPACLRRSRDTPHAR